MGYPEIIDSMAFGEAKYYRRGTWIYLMEGKGS
jgi:hypothetical protein